MGAKLSRLAAATVCARVRWAAWATVVENCRSARCSHACGIPSSRASLANLASAVIFPQTFGTEAWSAEVPAGSGVAGEAAHPSSTPLASPVRRSCLTCPEPACLVTMGGALLTPPGTGCQLTVDIGGVLDTGTDGFGKE